MRLRTLGIFAALGVLSCAGSVSAQTTTCNNVAGTVVCNTMTDPLAGMAMMAQHTAPVLYRWQDVTPKACSKLEWLASDGNFCDARAVAANRKAVGDLIGEGRCPDALKAALGTGDLVFAREVRDFCQPVP